MNPLQWLRDWLLEREIRFAASEMSRALTNWGVNHRVFRRAARDYDKLARKRSPQQLARMKGRGE